MRIQIGETPVDLLERQRVFATVTGWLSAKDKPRQIVTLNSLMIVNARKNLQFQQVLQQADLVVIDSYGIELALRKKGFHEIHRCAGIELVREILSWCAENGATIYCYGGPPGLPEKLRLALTGRWPNLMISGIRDGFETIISREQASVEIGLVQPDLLLVGLGSPQQELFLAEELPKLQGTVGMGVGGALEVIAGKREAPRLIRKNGWEWLFRMFQDPRRFKHLPKLIEFWSLHIGWGRKGDD